jgi:hypothetical protein
MPRLESGNHFLSLEATAEARINSSVDLFHLVLGEHTSPSRYRRAAELKKNTQR